MVSIYMYIYIHIIVYTIKMILYKGIVNKSLIYILYCQQVADDNYMYIAINSIIMVTLISSRWS